MHRRSLYKRHQLTSWKDTYRQVKNEPQVTKIASTRVPSLLFPTSVVLNDYEPAVTKCWHVLEEDSLVEHQPTVFLAQIKVQMSVIE